MKSVHSNLCLILTVILVLCPLTAQAATLNYEPGNSNLSSTLVGRVPLTKLGSIEVPRGRIQFSQDGTVEVTAIPEWQFDRIPVLTGSLVKASADANGQSATIAGMIYFLEGEWYPYVDSPKTPDIVVLDGEQVSGRITTITTNSVSIDLGSNNSREIPRSSIKDIQSPRVYVFNVSTTAAAAVQAGQSFQSHASYMTLVPTGKIFRLAALKKDPLLVSDGDWSNKKLWAVTSGLIGIQLLQMVPALAVPLGSNHLREIAKNKTFATVVEGTFPFGNFAPINNRFNAPLSPFTLPLGY